MFPTIKESLYRNKGISNLNQAKNGDSRTFFYTTANGKWNSFRFLKILKKRLAN